MSNNLLNLPDELKLIIFNYSISCKKQQNYFVNKELTELLNKQFCKCKGALMLNKIICKNCDKVAYDFLSYLGTTFI